MRNTALIALLAAYPALAAPADDKRVQPDPAQCLQDAPRFAQTNPGGGTRKLGEMPPGDLSLAVVREVEGCRTATVVRYGYGLGNRNESAGPAKKGPLPK